jgi:hypothetical protein
VLEDVRGKLVGEHEPIARFCPIPGWRIDDFVQSVFDFRREADRAVTWDGPGGSGPNDDAGLIKLRIKLYPSLR